MGTRAFIVIQAADQAAANVAAEQFVGQGVPPTFSVGLVPTGSPVGTAPTHFICSALFTDANWVLLPSVAGSFPTSHYAQYDLATAPAAPWTYCASVNLMRQASVLP